MKSITTFVLLALAFVLLAVEAGETRVCTHCNCLTTATCNGGTLLMCPAGDGPTLADIGSVIEVTVLDFDGQPVPGMLAEDFWIARTTPPYTVLCGGVFSTSADAPTDAEGKTTLSGSVAAGGFADTDVHVIANGWPVQASPECDSPLPLVLVSPDIDGNLTVDVVDLAIFALSFPPNAYAKRADMNGDGLVSLEDLSLFAMHWGHVCEL